MLMGSASMGVSFARKVLRLQDLIFAQHRYLGFPLGYNGLEALRYEYPPLVPRKIDVKNIANDEEQHAKLLEFTYLVFQNTQILMQCKPLVCGGS